MCIIVYCIVKIFIQSSVAICSHIPAYPCVLAAASGVEVLVKAGEDTRRYSSVIHPGCSRGVTQQQEMTSLP